MIAIATRTRGRIIHTSNGKTVFQRYGKDDSECNYSISRYELNKVPTPKRSRQYSSLYALNHEFSPPNHNESHAASSHILHSHVTKETYIFCV